MCLSPCSIDYYPVCSSNGITYNNLCSLICYTNDNFEYSGECDLNSSDEKQSSCSNSSEENIKKRHKFGV